MGLTDHLGAPCLLDNTPVYALHKHRKLRAAQVDLTLFGRRPDKPALLKPLCEQAGGLAIPPNNLDLITAPPAE
jgi:hypothetical protein